MPGKFLLLGLGDTIEICCWHIGGGTCHLDFRGSEPKLEFPCDTDKHEESTETTLVHPGTIVNRTKYC